MIIYYLIPSVRFLYDKYMSKFSPLIPCAIAVIYFIFVNIYVINAIYWYFAGYKLLDILEQLEIRKKNFYFTLICFLSDTPFVSSQASLW